MNYCRKQIVSPQLILFGGTFDPPHKGHLGCVSLALRSFPTAKLWVLPAFQPAGAAGQHKRPQASFAERLAMCELLFRAHLSPAELRRVTIARLEEALPAPNLTVTTLQVIKEQAEYAEQELCFLIGEDQWRSFSRWASPHEILKLSSLLIVRRHMHDANAPTLQEQIERVVAELGLSLKWLKSDHALLEELPSSIYLIDAAPSPATSTLMRQYFQREDAMPEDWLTDEVKKYIDKYGLYKKELKGKDA